jgi:hypothetical protein
VTAPVQEQYIEASPASRRKLGVLFAMAVIGGLITLEFLLPRYLAHVRVLPFCEQVEWVEATLLALLLALMLPAAWLLAAARRVLRLERWPLPGALVWQRIEIQRGPQVRRRAHLMLGSAALLVVLALVLAGQVHGFMESARATRCAAR